MAGTLGTWQGSHATTAAMSAGHDITALLGKWASGDRQALEDLTPRVYAELRRLAAAYLRNERPDHTLQPTELVHEAYLRLVDQKVTPRWQNRSHFFGIAARLMRQILVDHARRRQTGGRAGRKVPIEAAISLPGGRSADLLALEDALQALEELDRRKCKAIELHYFGGLSIKEIAEALNLSDKTIRRDLAFSEAWLYQEMRKWKHP